MEGGYFSDAKAAHAAADTHGFLQGSSPDPERRRAVEEALRRQKSTPPAQLALASAVGTLKEAASMRYNVKGGPDRAFLLQMLHSLGHPEAPSDFLCDVEGEIERIRNALMLVWYIDRSRIEEIEVEIRNLLDKCP